MFSFYLHMSYIKWMVSVHKSHIDVLDLESNAIEEKVKMPKYHVSRGTRIAQVISLSTYVFVSLLYVHGKELRFCRDCTPAKPRFAEYMCVRGSKLHRRVACKMFNGYKPTIEQRKARFGRCFLFFGVLPASKGSNFQNVLVMCVNGFLQCCFNINQYLFSIKMYLFPDNIRYIFYLDKSHATKETFIGGSNLVRYKPAFQITKYQ